MQGVLLESSRRLLQRCGPPCLQFQSVRWIISSDGHAPRRKRGRKPWWLPIAKTKEFKLPNIKVYPKEEEEEIRRLENHYATYKRSLWAFMKERYEANEALAKTHAKETTEDAEIERITALIERDNAIVRAKREQELKIEWKNMEQQIIETRSILEEEDAAKLAATEQLLKSEMERLKTAIPLEGIEEAIEKALASEVDYNFSIDKKGNKYYGRRTKPSQDLLQEPQRQIAANS